MRFVFCLLLVLLPGAVMADEAQVDGVAIIDYGIYETQSDDSQRIASPGTALGYVQPLTAARLAMRSEMVCARLGVSFGIEYRLHGAPYGRTVEIDVVTRFPPQGMINANGVRFDRNAYKWPVTIGEPNIRTFTFDEPWEMIAGTWTLEFHHQGRKLGEQSFTVMTACLMT